MSGCSPKCNGGLAYRSQGFCHTLAPHPRPNPSRLTRKHEIVGPWLERGRRNHLPLSCLCVLSDMLAICRCNRVSFAISGQVRWGILMASSVVPEDP